MLRTINVFIALLAGEERISIFRPLGMIYDEAKGLAYGSFPPHAFTASIFHPTAPNDTTFILVGSHNYKD